MLVRKSRIEFKIKVRRYYKVDYDKHATPPKRRKNEPINLYGKSAYMKRIVYIFDEMR